MDDILKQAVSDPGRLARAIQEMALETQHHVQPPPIAVETRVVEPPVELRARLDLHIVFPHDSIVGKSRQDIEESIMAVIYGQQSPWLPQITPGKLEVWREVVRGSGEDAYQRGVPGPGYRDDQEFPGNPGPGNLIRGKEPDDDGSRHGRDGDREEHRRHAASEGEGVSGQAAGAVPETGGS